MREDIEIARSKSRKIELVVQQLSSLPTLPAVAARLLQITIRSDTQASEVVRLIESDPALASTIIALATRSHRGVSSANVTVAKAVVLLGFDTVRNAVLSIKVFEALGGVQNEQPDGFDREGFWIHSLAVGCAARMLMPHIDRRVDPDEAFICGLLHDMGKVALAACLPKSFARVVELTEAAVGNIAEVEQRILGVDHTIVGKRLAEKWTLPNAIKETVWLHQQNVDALPDAVKHRTVVQTVHLADALAREQRIGYSGNHHPQETAAAIARKLNCPDDTLQKTACALRDHISERAMLLGLDELNPDQLYHQALANANSELGRLNLRLQQHNQALQRRSAYFELLRSLNDGLGEGQSVVDVCSLLAEIWQEHLQGGHTAAYALGLDEPIIEGALKLETDPSPNVFLLDESDDSLSEHNPDHPLPAAFTVSPVDNTYAWFFEHVAPSFAFDATLVMPLRRGDQLVGALLWEDKQNTAETYQCHLKELEAFSAAAALALRQAQNQQQQSLLSEQLAQTNRALYDTQDELIQKRSMAAVGEMACGAAHEINNPLAVLVGRSELLASSQADTDTKATLATIAKSGREISNIMTELMQFAKPAPPQPKHTNLADLIHQALADRTEYANEQNVQLMTDLAADLPDICVDPQQLVPALSELINNAIESYQGNPGTVTVRGYVPELEDQAFIDVIDHGIGMDHDTLEKACDPFFSLKQAGRGRGLGLSRASRTLQENHARLRLTTEPQHGTTARVALPISHNDLSNAANQPIATNASSA